MPMPVEIDSLVARIAVLERQNRRWQRAGAALLFAAGAVVLMAQAKGGSAPKAKVVQAQVFELVDGSGKVVATLDGRGGPSLVRFDMGGSAGKERLSLVASDDASLVRLADSAGHTVSLLVGSTGPALSVEDAGRKGQVVLGIGQKGAIFSLSDQGEVGVAVVTGPTGRGIALYDAAGKPTWKAPE